MRFVWNAADKDLRRLLRDPLALALWLGIPLFVGGLLSMVLGGNRASSPPTAHLLLADEDGGNLSRLFSRAFGRDGQFLKVEEVQRDAGRARIGRGEATALLVIPHGFADAVLNERPTTLLLVTNPSQQILPQILEECLELLADGTFYLHRTVGPQLRQITSQSTGEAPTFSNAEIAQLSVSINEVVQRVEPRLFPPVIQVETSVDQAPSPAQRNVAQLFLPGVIFMALVFMAQGLSDDVWRERAQGTLRRSACAPSSLMALLAGKLFASGIVIFASASTVLAVGMLYFGIPLAKLPLAAIWSTISGVVMLSLFLLIQLYASTPRAGSILISSIVMPLLFLGGSFFPFEIMPEWMAAIGRRTPNGWALTYLNGILFDRENVASLAAAMVGCVTLAVILFLLSERRLRSVLARG
jgi:ABC-type multidrug transport system permease subunit